MASRQGNQSKSDPHGGRLANLSVGDSVSVYSKTFGNWVNGKVVIISVPDNDITVEYNVNSQRLRTTVAPGSARLRLPLTGTSGRSALATDNESEDEIDPGGDGTKPRSSKAWWSSSER